MIPRLVSDRVKQLSEQFPVVTITGPRQAGKTTLCKALFPDKPYVSLENLDDREFANNDPRGFLASVPSGAVLDEIQRVPSLLSYIQGVVDDSSLKGMFILTGSQQFELLSFLNQSLAGRTAIIKLLPFSYAEVYGDELPTMETVLYNGFYPRVFDDGIKPTDMYSFYLNTYVERDLRQLINIKDLSVFEVFLKLCAARTGQLLNYSSIANEIDVDIKTVKSWLSILEASYIVKILRPYYKSMNKRLVKTPKLYFLDTGLAAFLLGVKNADQLIAHPLKGELFETYVLGEIWKRKFNAVEPDNLFFYRDHQGNEIDVIGDNVISLSQLEVKLSRTISSRMLKPLSRLKKIGYSIENSFLVHGGEDSYERENSFVVSWRNVDQVIM